MSWFYGDLCNMLNTGQSRAIILCGNIYDLFYLGAGGEEKFVPLIDFLAVKGKVEPEGRAKGITLILYRLNSNVQIIGGYDELAEAWKTFKGPVDGELDKLLEQTNGNPTYAFELLRQLTACSRTANLKRNLLIIIEGAELALPQDDIARMNIADRRRIGIVQSWFCDPAFNDGHDSVILIAESQSQIHRRVSALPQVATLEIQNPDLEDRRRFINHLLNKTKIEIPDPNDLAEISAGLSLHAIRQLFCLRKITHEDVFRMVEKYVCQQLGDGVVEFKRPKHTFKDVLGFKVVKKFLVDEVVPRFRADPDSALPGAAVGGPIGGGKTYICEALAAELGLPVLVLKNLRSKWFGETDVVVERLRRILEAFHKVVIFVDEADTAFGGVSGEVHETEKRLTGKIQAMMSDTALRGRVLWLLMTARINALSPDIRRPGRVGDLIIPILDPQDEDRNEFLKWVLPDGAYNPMGFHKLDMMTQGYSSAAFAALRSLVKAKKCKTIEDVLVVAEDMIPSDIGLTRRYQTLQALLNTTRFSLMPEMIQKAGRDQLEDKKREWAAEAKSLELQLQ